MKILSNSEVKNHKTEILTAFEFAEEIIICTAFLKYSGLKSLLEVINKKSIKVTFYVRTNFYQTEPNALKQLFRDNHIIYLNRESFPTFHPKIFFFRTQNNVKLYIGSANLTSGGLENNIETSIECDTTIDSLLHKDLMEQFTYFNTKSKKIEILETILDYEKRYKIYRERHKIADIEFKKEEEIIIERERLREEERHRKIEEEKLKSKQSTSTTERNRNRFLITDEYKETWLIYFNEFIEFKKENGGNTIIPQGHKLHNWYKRQREFYNHRDENGIRAILPDHLELLDKENFFWGNPNEIIWMQKWENKLARVDAYCKSKKQKFAWITVDKKNKQNPLNDLAQWCMDQRLRLEQLKNEKNYKTKKRKITEYEIKRLKDIHFLESSEDDEKNINQEVIIDKLILIEQLKKERLSQNNYKWLPSQTDPNPEIADLGNWLEDKFVWIKSQRKKNENREILQNIVKELEDLEINTELGIIGTYFDFFAKKYKELRSKYPMENPKGEERKPYAKVIQWEITNRNKFDKYPEWRQIKLKELGITRESPNS
jgi:HKD family nuclease